MADFKRNMFRHLRSARQWLAQAEEAFDKESNVRGELDLFLAQAELQRARETTSSRKGWFSFPLFRQAITFALAAAVLAAGSGIYWTVSERNASMPIPLAAQQRESASVAKLTGPELAGAPVVKQEEPQPVKAEIAADAPKPVVRDRKSVV